MGLSPLRRSKRESRSENPSARETMEQPESSATVDDGGHVDQSITSPLTVPTRLPSPARDTHEADALTETNADTADETDRPSNERALDDPSGNSEPSTIVDDQLTQSPGKTSTPTTPRSTDLRKSTPKGPKPIQTPPKPAKKDVHIRDIERG